MARRPAVRLLVVPQRRAALEKIVLHATNLRIPIVEVEGGSLTALAGFDGHQGVALVVEPRRFAGIDDVLARAAERGEPPFVLVLDSMEDPHNVGSLLRSAEAAGVHGVLFPTHRQAPLSPSAVKASAGAVEHLLLCPVDDLAGALSDLHAHGLRVAGADGDAPMTARESDLRGPIAIVVGSEGQGLGPAVRRRCDLFMRIPMRGAVGSLNAAVAGSILLFEAVAQREPIGDRTGEDAVDPQPVAAPEPAAAVASPAGPMGGRKAKPKVRAKPTTTAKPKVRAKPTTTAKPKVAAKPTTTAKPKVAAKPAIAAKPKVAAKPAIAAKPKVAAKPKSAAKPATAAKSATAAKPKVAAKPRSAAEPAAPKPRTTPKPAAAPASTAAAKSRTRAKSTTATPAVEAPTNDLLPADARPRPTRKARTPPAGD